MEICLSAAIITLLAVIGYFLKRSYNSSSRLTAPDWIKFIECESAGDTPLCQICGEPVAETDNSMKCPLCGTAHHKDCWEFNEGCSTYACQGHDWKTWNGRAIGPSGIQINDEGYNDSE